MTEPTVDLHRLQVFFRGNAYVATLWFKGENMAKGAFKRICEAGITDLLAIEDQYGNALQCLKVDIMFPFLTKISEDLQAQGQNALATARAQARANKQAQADLSINSPLAVAPNQMHRG